MEAFIAWSGFAGAWLLVAGPVFQAATEISEQDFEREGFAAAWARYTPPPRPSAWWWLLPPVAYLLHWRRSRRIRTDIMELWTPNQRRMYAQFGNKTTGWAMVAGAGVLLALRETWSLAQHYRWPALVFWLLTAVMTVLSAGYTAGRMSRTARPYAGEVQAGGESAP